MLWFLVSSPAQYDKLGKDWDKFASRPSGTGPFKLTKLVPYGALTATFHTGIGCLVGPSLLYLAVRAMVG